MRRNRAPPIKRRLRAPAGMCPLGAPQKTAARPPKGGATQQARAPEIQGAYAGFPLPAFVDVGEAVFHDLGDVVVIEGILDLFALFGALDELCPPQHPQLVRDRRNAHA